MSSFVGDCELLDEDSCLIKKDGELEKSDDDAEEGWSPFNV